MKIVLLTLLISSSANAETKFFSEPRLFNEPMADPRAAASSFTVNTSKYYGYRLWYIDAAIGKSFPISTHRFSDLYIQTNLAAAGWLSLGYTGGLRFPLITEDFLLSMPVLFKYKRWSWYVAYNHISSHMGDGMSEMLEATLSEKERKQLSAYQKVAESSGMEVIIKEPETYSREFITSYVSYRCKIGILDANIYGVAGYNLKVLPEELGRGFVGNGFEIEYYYRTLTPYYSQDVRWNNDVGSLDYSGQLGAILMNDDDNLVRFRFAFTLYAGSDRRGQMVGKDIERFGFGIFME